MSDLIDLASVPADTSYTLADGTNHAALQQQFLRKRLEAHVVLPTDEKRVQARLRDLGEPIILFGEGPGDTRERLRAVLVDIELEKGGDGGTGQPALRAGAAGGSATAGTPPPAASDTAASDIAEEFFTPGSDRLVAAREEIARFSLGQAARRLAYQRIESTIPAVHQLRHRGHVKAHLAGLELAGSQLAGDRPVCAVRVAPGDALFAAADVGGAVKIFDAASLAERAVLRAHTGRVGGLAWFPAAGPVEMPAGAGGPDGSDMTDASLPPQLVSSGAEGTIQLWNVASSTPVASLTGHSARVCRVDVHPSGRYVGSASFDHTWRLWDVEAGTAVTTSSTSTSTSTSSPSELLIQEGHSREVYTLAFHPDGSLVASAGLDAIGRVWDLRTGRSVMVLHGHVGPVYGLDWLVDGFRLLSGSADGAVKCWDIRKVAEAASTGGHSGGVADLRAFRGQDGPAAANPVRTRTAASDISMGAPGDEDGDGAGNGPSRDGGPAADEPPPHAPKSAGTFFVSAGFDKLVNVFSADDWAVCRPLAGHASNALAVDVSSDARFIVSGGQDRTVKVWSRDDGGGVY